MPFGDSKDWDDCVKKRMASGKYTKEVAEKVCGKMKAELEKGVRSHQDSWGNTGETRTTAVSTESRHKSGSDINNRTPLENLPSSATRKKPNFVKGTKEECKTCSKEFEESEPSPEKKDLKELSQNIKKANEWVFDPTEVLTSKRKVTGTFHVPKIDKDNELITKSAMERAIPDFMHLPILHDFHKERVLGVITRVWEEADVYHFDAIFKATHDVDDAWNKVQKGEYDHVSIYGSRLKGSASCGLNPNQRSQPCISEAIRLDSISACDENARNDHTSLTLAKGLYSSTEIINTNETFIKAMDSGSSLSHGTYDGVRRESRGSMRVKEVDDEKERDDEIEADEKEVEKAEERIPLKREKEKEKVKNTGVRQAEEDENFEKAETDCKHPMLNKIYDVLMKLVASDKKVHSEIGKAESEDEEEEEDEEKKAYSRAGRSAVEGREQKKPGMHTPSEASRDYGARQTEKIRSRFQKGSVCPKVTEEEDEDEEKKAAGFSEAGRSAVAHHRHNVGKPITEQEGMSAARREVSKEKRFQKGGKRPKVTEEEATKPAFSQPVNKKVVEKSERDNNSVKYEGGPGNWRNSKSNSVSEQQKKTGVADPWNAKEKVEKGERPKVTEEPATKEGTKQPVDKRIEEKAKRPGGPLHEPKFHPSVDTRSHAEKDWGPNHAPSEDRSQNTPIKKGDTMTDENDIVKANLTDDMTDEQFVQEIVKASLPKTDEIVKAQVDEIKKAFEKEIADLKAELKEIKEQPISKAAVLIPDENGKVDGVALNYDAIDKFMKRG